MYKAILVIALWPMLWPSIKVFIKTVAQLDRQYTYIYECGYVYIYQLLLGYRKRVISVLLLSFRLSDYTRQHNQFNVQIRS